MVEPPPRRNIAEGQGREGSDAKPIVVRSGLTAEQFAEVKRDFDAERAIMEAAKWVPGAEDADLKAMVLRQEAARARSARRTQEEPNVPTVKLDNLGDLLKTVYSGEGLRPMMLPPSRFSFPVFDMSGAGGSTLADRTRALAQAKIDQAAKKPDPEPARTVSTRRFQNLDFGDDE